VVTNIEVPLGGGGKATAEFGHAFRVDAADEHTHRTFRATDIY
jgi:hypothetical protein